MADIPTLSFIVITRNRKDELVRVLENILGQDWPRKELILVDNGSIDDTAEFVRIHYPEVHLIESEVNLGVAGGRNRGAQAAIGEFLVFLDDDAELSPPVHSVREGGGRDGDYIRSLGSILRDYFDGDPRLAVIAFTIQNIVTGEEEYASIPRFDKRAITDDYDCSYFGGCGFAIRRAVFLDVGMFWESLVYSAQELDLGYILVQQGYRLVHTSSVCVKHRNVPTARPKGQYIYHSTRDRPWVALRHLPWLYVVTTICVWWVRLALMGMRTKQFAWFLRGLADSLFGVKAALQLRRPIGANSLRILKETSGRLWW